MYCEKCGSKNSENATFCTNCVINYQIVNQMIKF